MSAPPLGQLRQCLRVVGRLTSSHLEIIYLAVDCSPDLLGGIDWSGTNHLYLFSLLLGDFSLCVLYARSLVQERLFSKKLNRGLRCIVLHFCSVFVMMM